MLLSQVSDNAEFMVFEREPRVCFHLDQKVMNSLDKIELSVLCLELQFLTEKCSCTICYWFYVRERAWVLPQNLDADFKLSGCLIFSSLNEGDLKITLFENIVGKYFLDNLDFQTKF